MEMHKHYENKGETDYIIEDMISRVNLSGTLEELIKIVNGVNFEIDVLKMIDRGLLKILMGLLKDKQATK